MRQHSINLWVPKNHKQSAKSKLAPTAEAFDNYDPGCLFVSNEKGTRCGRKVHPHRRHTISRKGVLEPMMDKDSGKVMESFWGMHKMADFFIRSDEANPIDLYDPSKFEPREVGIGEASTVYSACEVHDPQFSPIDIANPDFEVPIVALMAHFPAYLWAEYQLMRVKWILESKRSEVMRGRYKTHRCNWYLQWNQIDRVLPDVHNTVTRLGTAWHTQRKQANTTPELIASREILFRSNLTFATCLFFGLKAVASVLPVEQDLRKVCITYLSEEKSVVSDCITGLSKIGETSLQVTDYGVGMLRELFRYGSGILEMSPASYGRLGYAERSIVNELIRNMSEADHMADGLSKLAAERKWK